MAQIYQTGFQPSSTPGFQNDFQNEGFNPKAAFGGDVDTDFIAAYYRGVADAVPTGYDQGLRAGAAQAKGEPRDKASSTGFIDTTESAAYGQGYAQGLAQGYAAGYTVGVSK